MISTKQVLCLMFYAYHVGTPLKFLAHCVSYETSFMFISCWIEVVLVTHHVLCFMFYMTRTLVHMKYSPHFFFCQIYAPCMKWFYVLCFICIKYEFQSLYHVLCYVYSFLEAHRTLKVLFIKDIRLYKT